MKKLLIILLIAPLLSFAQKDTTYSFSTPLKRTMKEQVFNSMIKYHNSHRSNDFYNYNVVKEPILNSEDSIIYNIKLIAGRKLWGAKGKFTSRDGFLICQLSDLTILKKTGLMAGVDYVNIKLKDLEDTKGNMINRVLLEEEIEHFFKYFK